MSERSGEPAVTASSPSSGQGSFLWDDPPCSQALAASPVLAVDGFDGPLDWLLDMARARKINLAQLSILALVEAFAGAMEAAMTRRPDALAPDLARWGDWTVMASDLALLRSRLLLPASAPAAVTARVEAETLRRQWIHRAQTADAADWLEAQPQLGRDVFARGRAETWRSNCAEAGPPGQGAADEPNAALDPPPPETADMPVAGGDLTDLLRACLVALRLPSNVGAYQLRPPPFWSTGDAAARIIRLLDGLPEGAMLEAFVPRVDASAGRALHCRVAIASTFVASLELTRDGSLTLDQKIAWHPIHVQRRGDGALQGASTASLAAPDT